MRFSDIEGEVAVGIIEEIRLVVVVRFDLQRRFTLSIGCGRYRTIDVVTRLYKKYWKFK